MSRTLAMLLAVVALAASACKSAAPLPPKALELNRQGAQALAAGDLETAEARFALALEYNDKFVEALVNQALVEMQRGNFVAARRLLKRAKRLNPDVAQPYHGLGVLAERERRPDEASEHYAEALKIDPGFAPARANLARILFDAGMYEHARVQFKRLVEAAPEEPAGYSGLSEALLQLGREQQANEILADGLTRFPEDAPLLILMARVYVRAGHFERAVEILEPLCEKLDDVAVAALGWTATAELALGRPRKAAKGARRAVSLDPSSSVAVYALAAALTQLGDPQAPAWVARAKRLAPDAPAPDAVARGELVQK